MSQPVPSTPPHNPLFTSNNTPPPPPVPTPTSLHDVTPPRRASGLQGHADKKLETSLSNEEEWTCERVFRAMEESEVSARLREEGAGGIVWEREGCF